MKDHHTQPSFVTPLPCPSLRPKHIASALETGSYYVSRSERDLPVQPWRAGFPRKKKSRISLKRTNGKHTPRARLQCGQEKFHTPDRSEHIYIPVFFSEWSRYSQARYVLVDPWSDACLPRGKGSTYLRVVPGSSMFYEVPTVTTVEESSINTSLQKAFFRRKKKRTLFSTSAHLRYCSKTTVKPKLQ